MKTKIFTALLATLMFAACSPKKDDVSVTYPGPTPLQSKIQGPTVTGKWESHCVYNYNEDVYRKKTAEFTDNNVVRTDMHYSDKDCLHELAKSGSKYHGTYAWDSKTTYGGYLIMYRFDLGNGWSQDINEELLIENDFLYLSDFSTGFGIISHDLPLSKIQN